MSASPEKPWLEPTPVLPLTGEERFLDSDITVRDFWSWGFSDLRTNIVRGVLAEFLVARALGDPSPVRQAWDNFDVTTPSGIRVEVKSSGYLQSWRQKTHSQIVFSGLTGRIWSPHTNELGEERELRADVYVFAIHTQRDPTLYESLNLDDWEFQVLPVHVLREASVRSITRSFLDQHGATPVRLHELAAAVDRAYESSYPVS